jgi:hypothetical protein
MARKFFMTVAIVAITLAPPIGIGIAEAHGGGYGGGGPHGEGFHGGGFRGRSFHDRDDFGRREFRRDGIRFGLFGGYYPGYYGYQACYRTIYGTAVCYSVLGDKAVLDLGLREPGLIGPHLDPDLFSASNADLAAACGRKRPRVVVHAALVGA